MSARLTEAAWIPDEDLAVPRGSASGHPRSARTSGLAIRRAADRLHRARRYHARRGDRPLDSRPVRREEDPWAVRDRGRAADRAVRARACHAALDRAPPDGRAGRGAGVRHVWTPDELVWFGGRARRPRVPGTASRWPGPWPRRRRGSRSGTWVLSALHRNPGIIAKTAETLDEISGGRFVFGLGAGHVWPGQAHAFGLPEDRIFARFEEALADHRPADAHRTRRLRGRVPRGPRPAPAARRAAAERDPAAHRRERAEGPATRRSSTRTSGAATSRSAPTSTR